MAANSLFPRFPHHPFCPCPPSIPVKENIPAGAAATEALCLIKGHFNKREHCWRFQSHFSRLKWRQQHKPSGPTGPVKDVMRLLFWEHDEGVLSHGLPRASLSPPTNTEADREDKRLVASLNSLAGSGRSHSLVHFDQSWINFLQHSAATNVSF